MMRWQPAVLASAGTYQLRLDTRAYLGHANRWCGVLQCVATIASSLAAGRDALLECCKASSHVRAVVSGLWADFPDTCPLSQQDEVRASWFPSPL